MAKILNVSFNDEYVIFTDEKNQSEKIALQTPDAPETAIRVAKKEVEGRENASRAYVSLLLQILNTPRMDAYKGQTPVGSKIPPQVMSAMREAEETYLKPLFMECFPKNAKENIALVAWDEFISTLRTPGSYVTARGSVMKYFAHMGKLPCLYHADEPVLDKILTTSSMDKILNNAKAKAGAQAGGDHSVGAKLEALSAELDKNETKLDIEAVERALRAVAAVQLKLQALRQDLNTQVTEHAQNLTNAAVQEAKHKEPAHA